MGMQIYSTFQTILRVTNNNYYKGSRYFRRRLLRQIACENQLAIPTQVTLPPRCSVEILPYILDIMLLDSQDPFAM